MSLCSPVNPLSPNHLFIHLRCISIFFYSFIHVQGFFNIYMPTLPFAFFPTHPFIVPLNLHFTFPSSVHLFNSQSVHLSVQFSDDGPHHCPSAKPVCLEVGLIQEEEASLHSTIQPSVHPSSVRLSVCHPSSMQILSTHPSYQISTRPLTRSSFHSLFIHPDVIH